MPFPKTRAEMIAQGYQYAGGKRCGCGVAMEFWKTPSDRCIPMNPMPEDGSEAVSHFGTCKDANLFRKLVESVVAYDATPTFSGDTVEEMADQMQKSCYEASALSQKTT